MPRRSETDSTNDSNSYVEVLEPVAVDAPPGCCVVMPVGRGKTGKTVWLRWLIEAALERGDQIMIADGDRTNATLSAFFPEVNSPNTTDDDGVKAWLMGLLDHTIQQRQSVYLDLGGGDLALKALAREVDLANFLEENGVSLVLAHFLGADRDDLSYLRDVEEAGFRPKNTALILNEGLIQIGRQMQTAFGPTLEHEIFKRAVERGASVFRMPRLAPMPEIENRRLLFAAAQKGEVGQGHQHPMGPTARQLVAMWRREMASSFARVVEWTQ